MKDAIINAMSDTVGRKRKAGYLMAERNTKVIRYKNRWHGSVIGFLFLFILIYLIVQIYFFLTKDKISIFEVQEKALYSAASGYRGMITREETIVPVEKETYVNYSVREGLRSPFGSTIYTTEDISAITEALLKEYSSAQVLSEASIKTLKAKLEKASQHDLDANFSLAYQDKNELEVSVLDAYLMIASDALEGFSSEDKYCVKSEESGYILFRTDSYDGYMPKDVTMDCFNEDYYSMKVFGNGELRKKGDFAYKLVPDDSFCITFPISEKDAARYRNKKYLSIELTSISVTVNGAFEIYTASDNTLMATVSLNKYGSSYLTERFIDFKIAEDDIKGYKIPKSTVLSKDFLVVPQEYVINSEARGVGIFKEVMDDDGNIEAVFTKISIYAKQGNSYYISASGLSTQDYLIYAEVKKDEDDNTETITTDLTKRRLIAVSAPLTGVYSVNRGYCIFRQVEIQSETSDNNYYIINSGTNYGLSAYDRIILNAELVTENQIIY